MQIVICTIELSWKINSKIEDIDGQSTRAAMIASIAMLSYD
jgi:hypothetical protein